MSLCLAQGHVRFGRSHAAMGLARTAEAAVEGSPADGFWTLPEGARMPIPLAVAFAGALGALARYGLDGLIARRAPGAFRWGTSAINVSGSLLLGLLFTVFTEKATADTWIRSGVTIG